MSYNLEENAIFNRFTLMLTEEEKHRLFSARVIVLGVGGVGGAVANMLIRSGIHTSQRPQATMRLIRLLRFYQECRGGDSITSPTKQKTLPSSCRAGFCFTQD